MDTQFALIVMNTSFNLPMVIWLMMGFFEQLPYSLEESGMLDGAGFYRRYWDIILPITKPGLIASAILTFVATWNEFLFAVILTIKKTKTLPVVIAGFITDRGLDWGPMASGFDRDAGAGGHPGVCAAAGFRAGPRDGRGEGLIPIRNILSSLRRIFSPLALSLSA